MAAGRRGRAAADAGGSIHRRGARHRADFLIVGSGIAGLRAAVELAGAGGVLRAHQGRRPDEGNTGYAQGGIAAAVGRRRFARPPRRATRWRPATACATKRRARPGRRRARPYVAELLDWGAAFDRDPDGAVRARPRRRAQRAPRAARARRHRPRDRPRAVARATAQHARVHVIDHAPRRGADRRGRPCASASRYLDAGGRLAERRAPRATLLATGGAGQVFRETTNPAVATGDGIALAWSAGARGRRPRVRAVPSDGARRARARRASCCRRRCAARARGCSTPTASAFMTRYEPAGDLAPRDRVSRAIVREQARTGAPGLPVARASRRRRWSTRASRRSPPPAASAGLDLARDRDAGQPGGALRDGRRGDRSRRPHVGARAVRRRRGRVHGRPRRQPSRQQLAARGARLRRPRRRRRCVERRGRRVAGAAPARRRDADGRMPRAPRRRRPTLADVRDADVAPGRPVPRRRPGSTPRVATLDGWLARSAAAAGPSAVGQARLRQPGDGRPARWPARRSARGEPRRPLTAPTFPDRDDDTGGVTHRRRSDGDCARRCERRDARARTAASRAAGRATTFVTEITPQSEDFSALVPRRRPARRAGRLLAGQGLHGDPSVRLRHLGAASSGSSTPASRPPATSTPTSRCSSPRAC